MGDRINKKTITQHWQWGIYILLLAAFSTQAQTKGDGENLYQSLCSACHGVDLLGARGPNLVDENWTYGNTREAIAAVIQNGVSAKGMPGFNRVLDKDQVNHIVDYIFQMPHTNAPEPLQHNSKDTLETLDYVVNVKEYVRGLEVPWSLEFIDATTALITERPGRLRIVEKGHLREQPIADTPKVYHPERAQGGLLDIALHPDYKKNGWIYLAYTDALEPVEGEEYLPSMLCIVRGRIRDYRWVDEEIIYKADSRTYTTSPPYHYGSRMVFDSQGYLYFSVGDRYRQDNAQDLQRPNGKIHRLHADGSIPQKNPFTKNNNALQSIYSFGHRNPQGLAIHPETGELWAAEHGPKGGDELNLIKAGGNYGWPEISYGINYDGTLLTPHRRKPGMVQPSQYWRPSIAVSGITFYNGQRFPRWKNKLLLGALKYEELRLLDIDNGRVMHEEILLKNLGRVREAVIGPDGAIYVILDEPARIVQLTPRQERIQ